MRDIFPWIQDTHPCKCLRRRSNTSRSCSRNRLRQSFFLVCKFSPNRQTLSTFHQREVTYVTSSIVTLISWMNVFVVFLSCFMMLAPVSPVPHLVIISVWVRCDQEASKIPEDRQLSERFQQNTPQRIDFSWRDALTESPHGDVSGTFASLRVGQLEGFLIWKGEDGESPFLPHTPADICPIAILLEPYSKFASSQLVPIIPILQSVYADLVYSMSRRTHVHHSEFTLDASKTHTSITLPY